jgi:hypothetical protein
MISKQFRHLQGSQARSPGLSPEYSHLALGLMSGYFERISVLLFDGPDCWDTLRSTCSVDLFDIIRFISRPG